MITEQEQKITIRAVELHFANKDWKQYVKSEKGKLEKIEVDGRIGESLIEQIEKHKLNIVRELQKGKDIMIKKCKDGIRVQSLNVKIIK
ncbi:hypothetical protein [Hathewaya limosa]|uniref:Uncharacterized protein n=1 Tax=Hathewaya limosa TaxID=1536 RepID=A0ABU0JRL4_HATLI|nr:hypothetical protein [Hathewaya limosa]AWZ48307.1 hypothetical protein C3495_05495 [Clostridiaceae bacterium 14S0207]MDQ0479736.1 hypothetical protein [Hathewaya limosa]